MRAGEIGRDPNGGSVPGVVPLPADLPARALDRRRGGRGQRRAAETERDERSLRTDARARPAARATAEQQAAIEARDRDVFTEAGAGTGKTRVLVERYCDAVTEDGIGPDAILAFTFTERAAGELRQRIRRQLVASSPRRLRAGEHERARRSRAPHARASGRGSPPCTGSAGACCHASRRRPHGPALPRPRRARGRQARRARVRRGAGGGRGAGDDAVARFAAGFNPPRLRDRAGRARAASQPGSRPAPPAGTGSPGPSVKEKGESAELTPAEAALARRRLRGARRPARRLPRPLRAAQGRALRGRLRGPRAAGARAAASARAGARRPGGSASST